MGKLAPGSKISFYPTRKTIKHYKAGKPYIDLLPDPGDVFKDFMALIPLQALYNKWDEEGKVSNEPVIIDSDIFILMGQILGRENLARYCKRIEEMEEKENSTKNIKGEKNGV